jgi:hypothetical protein
MKSCWSCKHLRGRKVDRTICEAFPDGIPFPILAGQVAHDKPFKGDRGIVWERISKREAEDRLKLHR